MSLIDISIRMGENGERMKRKTFSVVVEPDEEEGGYVAYCPTLKGCVSQGETEEEALENIRDAIAVYLETLQAVQRGKRVVEVEIGV